MKKLTSIILVIVVTLLLCSCGTNETVQKEIYTGSKYMSIDQAEQYILGFLETKADFYEVTTLNKNIRLDLSSDIKDGDWLDKTIEVENGTKITFPCSYESLKKAGWQAEDNENEDQTYGSQFRCTSHSGSRITFLRDVYSNENHIKIKDSKVEGVHITCGDFAKKDNYVLILNTHPAFKYMGVTRESTPVQVIKSMGLPNEITHNGVNMTFTYTSYDYSTKHKTTVEISWLTMADGPEIMRDIKIRYYYMNWLLDS